MVRGTQSINPNTDYHEWKRVLKEAGLREARLDDARHTAATVLLVPRQPTPTVMSLMGLVEPVHGGPLPARDRCHAQPGG